MGYGLGLVHGCDECLIIVDEVWAVFAEPFLPHLRDVSRCTILLKYPTAKSSTHSYFSTIKNLIKTTKYHKVQCKPSAARGRQLRHSDTQTKTITLCEALTGARSKSRLLRLATVLTSDGVSVVPYIVLTADCQIVVCFACGLGNV